MGVAIGASKRQAVRQEGENKHMPLAGPSAAQQHLGHQPHWWDRHIMPHLIRCACSQGQLMKARSQIVPMAVGDVLELGCGGGINMQFYQWPYIKKFVGLDPSAELLSMSENAVCDADLAARGVDARIIKGVGEAMPFADASFDTVMTSFTLCSVHDQAATLAEIRRVLRPDGKALFLEHGRAPDEATAKWQKRIEAVWKRIAGNCHLTRSISAAYQQAGFSTEVHRAYYIPKTPRPFGWVEYGIARPLA